MLDLPDSFDALKPNHKIFVEQYMLHGQTAMAAVAAGHAAGYGAVLLKRPDVHAVLRGLREHVSEATIASVSEGLAILTGIARDPRCKPGERTSAVSTLLKAQGALGPDAVSLHASQSVTYQIGSGADLDTLAALAILARIADGEHVTPEEASECLKSVLDGAAVRD